MRGLSWLCGMALICSVGCGAEAGDDNPTDDKGEMTGSATGDQDDDDAPSDGNGGECSPAAAPVLSSYPGEKVWTFADFQACQAACPPPPPGQDPDPTCIPTQCAPGGDLFSDCVSLELNACLSGGTSPCRAEFGAQYCCVVENCDVESDAETLATCLQDLCEDERAAYSRCGLADEVFNPCATRAVQTCLVDGDSLGTAEPPPEEPGATENLDALRFELSPRALAPMLNGLRALDVQP